MSDRLLTAEQVADKLGVPKSWVYEASRRGEIPTVLLGRYRRFRREAIEDWIQVQERDGGGLETRLRKHVNSQQIGES